MASTSTSNPHLAFDAGLLMSVDSSDLDVKHFKDEKKREELIQSRVLASTRSFISILQTLPITQHPDLGPLAALPAPAYPILPREKPLPKPRAETKWEAFAKRKGIANKKKDKMVWDDETKEWVPRWGFKGKNKKEEEQWIHELPNNVDDDYNPVSALKKQRKERSLHNKGQQLKNATRANAEVQKKEGKSSSDLQSKPLVRANGEKKRADREQQMAKLDVDVLRSRGSTASMGRFDKTLEGEQKEKGIKRKFEANEVDASKERASHMALLNKMTNGTLAASKRNGDKDLVNVRKAVRFASDGKGSRVLAGDKGKPKGKGKPRK
ncbi:RRS1-domain-containing protein [Meira miltonrushii]|uniref:Ribosome biogenesis regulatory protein n=1 Tax=Meira miltonrushii TaxID=1280837 RepID=A0A316VGC7_9BASI|nr:RRS1-domain-containing protein [Meira miltonrushii]PWN36118.1 RRS1-domain-containing protein [Meira miltonrushii]